ncbi:MAG: hypothetical protein BROFUL_00998 [Candidatus Brocadia fulgida]|uniref:Uncharacterized protein n=1 Tax=Candidatus Brocadia fulgida TaxID=380242 RepID=A0A0M2V0P6_9BACT|nr:MAG: hypothetical protein BROFUL_00998 [Candidatus Brocadia fulgida]MBV6519293.1 hypothetical protein [Candidatus Brocadia fulgida]
MENIPVYLKLHCNDFAQRLSLAVIGIMIDPFQKAEN